MSGIFQLIYVSTESRKLDSDDLETLLRQSREKNSRLDVTGLLMYMEGHFIQLLEGPEDSVRSLYRVIQRDTRHEFVTTLYERTVPSRDFPTWSMGYRGGATNDPAFVDLTSILHHGRRDAYLANRTSTVRRLLVRFYDSHV